VRLSRPFSAAECFVSLLTSAAGTSGAASGNIKSMLDSAAKRIMPSPIIRTILDPDVSAQDILVQHVFKFDGMSTHDVLLLKLITSQLKGSIFFEALNSKNSLDVASVARFLLRYLPFPRLMALASSNNIVPVSMLLIHAFGATNHSFLNSPSLSYRRGSDPGAIAVAAADHVLRIKPLPCSRTSHLTAVLNQSRKVEVLKAASAPRPAPPAEQNNDSPVHISCDQNGNLYVCGAIKTVIRVMDTSGHLKHDLTIKTSDGCDLPVKFLRATTIDWSTGNIYVTDRDADALHCISPSGQVIASLPSGVLNKPRGLSWCARSRRLAVADYENHQVIILDSELNVIAKLKGPTPADKFQNPIDTDFDVNGFLYVMDSRNNRLHPLSPPPPLHSPISSDHYSPQY
jgi:hypothetical protein